MPIDIDQIKSIVDVRIAPSYAPQVPTGEEIKHADITATASGDTTVIPAVVGKRIRVTAVLLTTSAQVNIAWKSGASVSIPASTKIPAMSFPQYGGMNQNYLPGWFVETDRDGSLIINLSGNATVSGMVNYIEY